MYSEGQRECDIARPGVLYLVSTPIGNLRDITLRALDVLGSADLIAVEDTRVSAKLLRHYDINTPLTRYHDFNKERVTPALIARLKKDASVAVICDAGTPGISDPAFYLVRSAIGEDIPVQAIPGATAFVAALVLSGLPTDRFVFEGFLPAKKGRNKRLQNLSAEPRTCILYESPHRIRRTLGDLFEALSDRRIVLARELTKKFEQVERGRISELLSRLEAQPQRGEYVIVIEGCDPKSA